MIDWVNRRCFDWADWATRRQQSGLGFPAQSNYTRLTGGIRGRMFMGEWNAQAAQVDDVVRRLQPTMRQIVHQEYMRRGTDTQKAQALGVSVRTYYRRIDETHLVIAHYLHPKK